MYIKEAQVVPYCGHMKPHNTIQYWSSILAIYKGGACRKIQRMTHFNIF